MYSCIAYIYFNIRDIYMNMFIFYQETSEACGVTAMPTFQYYKDGDKVKNYNINMINDISFSNVILSYIFGYYTGEAYTPEAPSGESVCY